MAKYTAADGSRLHYWDIGTGPTCVLIHGFGMPAFLWLPFILPLATKYRFVLPDLRGFGGSHKAQINGDCTFTQYADDLNDLINHLGEPQVALAGFSMGACTSMQYHKLYGFDRISSYLQIDQAMCLSNSDDYPWGLFGKQQSTWTEHLKALVYKFEQEGTDKPFDALPSSLRKQLWRQFSRFTSTAFASRLLKGVAYLGRYERLVKNVAPTDNWRIYLDCIKAFANTEYDFRPTMGTLTNKPVWFFAGTHSEIYPLSGQLEARRWLPHAHMVTFERAGHALMFDSPRQFVRELGHFLSVSELH